MLAELTNLLEKVKTMAANGTPHTVTLGYDPDQSTYNLILNTKQQGVLHAQVAAQHVLFPTIEAAPQILFYGYLLLKTNGQPTSYRVDKKPPVKSPVIELIITTNSWEEAIQCTSDALVERRMEWRASIQEAEDYRY